MSALQPAERLNAFCNANWQLPKSGPALERILHKPKEGDFWQADHILAVAEGGGGCGLENLRTLCTPCHKSETERLRARLRLNGGTINSRIEGNELRGSTRRTKGKSQQMDIRSALFGSPKRSLKCAKDSFKNQTKRRKRCAD